MRRCISSGNIGLSLNIVERKQVGMDDYEFKMERKIDYKVVQGVNLLEQSGDK